MFLSSSLEQFSSHLPPETGQSQHGPLRGLKLFKLEPNKPWAMWENTLGIRWKKICWKKIFSLVTSKDWPRAVCVLSESLYLCSRWLFLLPSVTHPIQGPFSRAMGLWKNWTLWRGEARFLTDICLRLMVLRCLDGESFSGKLELVWREEEIMRDIHGQAGRI